MKLLIGAEITPEDAPPVVLWATDRAAYGRLARLDHAGPPPGRKGPMPADAGRRGRSMPPGLLAGVIDRIRKSEVGSRRRGSNPLILRIPPSEFRITATSSATAATCWPSCTAGRTIRGSSTGCAELARQSGVPLVAAGDVHYHVPQRQALCDVLTAMRRGCTVATAGERLFPNAQRHLRSPEEMAALFAR